MSYEKDVKITFYNMEYGEEVSDEYSEFLMINRDGEVFELVHNGRGDYNPSYEGDWVGYKMESRAKADEYKVKVKAFDEVMDLYVNGSNKYLQTKRHTLDVFIEDVAEILKPFTDEYESGEPNELRE